MDKIENRICVSLGNIGYEDCLAAVEKYPLCEIRLDLLNFSSPEIKEIFNCGNRLVATCRPGKLNDEERKRVLLMAIESGASYVDVEFGSADKYRDEIFAEAQKQNCQTIISYHNFEYTPAKNYLERIAQSCFDKEADIVKIACLPKGQNDLTKLYHLYSCFDRIISFGIGDFGKDSRIKSIELGAVFSYASLSPDKKTATGQMTFDEMKKLTPQLSTNFD